jgi:hypothetical protein
MFEANHRHNLFGFFLKYSLLCTGDSYIFKKTQFCGKQLPTAFYKHADACSKEWNSLLNIFTVEFNFSIHINSDI